MKLCEWEKESQMWRSGRRKIFCNRWSPAIRAREANESVSRIEKKLVLERIKTDPQSENEKKELVEKKSRVLHEI